MILRSGAHGGDTPTSRTPFDDLRDVLEGHGPIRNQRADSFMACCPAHEDGTPSLHVTRSASDGRVLLKCFGGCEADAVVAAVGWTLRDLYPATASGNLPRISSPRPSQTRIPTGEVESTWALAHAVNADDAGRAWVAARGLDVERVAAADLVRVFDARTALPSWATGPGRVTWTASGHRAALLAFDASGVPAGMRARYIGSGAPKHKALSPSRVASSGLVYADYAAEEMLRGTSKPTRVVVSEGEPDLLAARCYHLDPDTDAAVLGVFSGSWAPDVAAKIPDGATVAVWTHDDGTGEKYAAAVAATLAGRCSVVRGVFPVKRDGADKSDDLADLARAGRRLDLFRDVRAVPAPQAPDAPLPVDDVEAIVPADLWRSLDQVEADIASRPTPKMLWPGFLGSREVAVLAGDPKAGKSESAAAFVAAVTNGAEWLGIQLEAGHVVVVTEEGDGDLVQKLRRYGARPDHLSILSRDKIGIPPAWSVIVKAAVVRASKVGAALLVIDTFGFWANLQGDDERNEGVVGPLLKGLQAARDAGLAVLLIAHTVKSAEVEGIGALRGSGAFAASVEAVGIYRRSNPRDLNSPRRKLDVFSRPHGLTSRLVERVADEGAAVVPYFRVVSDDPAKTAKGETFNGTDRKILTALGKGMAWVSKSALVDLTGLKTRTLEGALPALVAADKIQRRGTGAKNSPLEYAALGVKNEVVEAARVGTASGATKGGK